MAGEELGTAFLNGLSEDPFERAAARVRGPRRQEYAYPLSAQPTQPVQQAPLAPLPTAEEIDRAITASNQQAASMTPRPWQGQSPRIAQPPASPEQDFMRVVQQQQAQPKSSLSPAQIAVSNAIDAGGRWVDENVGPAIPPELRGKAQAALQIANAVDPVQAAARVGPSLVKGDYGGAALDFFGAIPGESLVAGAGKLAALAGKGTLPAMFLGVGAKGADLAKLKQAEKLESAGTPIEQIRQQTGWDRDRGGKWQFEISDKGARYTPQPMPNRLEIAQDIFEAEGHPRVKFATGGDYSEPTRLALQKADAQIRMDAEAPKRLGDYLHHPELYAAEPRAAGIEVQQVPAIASGRGGARGSYSSIAGEKGGEPAIQFAETIGPGGPRKTLLHETSHAMDDLYGFPPGANNLFLSPGTPGWEIYKGIKQKMQTPLSHEEFSRQAGYGGEMAPPGDYKAYLRDLKGNAAKYDRMAQETAVEQGYRRSAGETKARNVEKRADMTPEELAATSPRATEDVPFEQQIVTKRTGAPEQKQETAGSVAAGMIKGDRASAGYSNVKAGTPIEEMTWKIEGAPQLPKRNIVAPDKAFRVGDEIIPIVGDATRAGGMLTEVGGRKLTKGYAQEGGPDYALLHANAPVEGSNAQRVWANAGGPATALTNLGKKVQERGNNPVLAYMTMNKEGGDFSKQMFGPTLDLLRQQGVGQKLERVIDNIMRSKHQAGNPVVWPGFASKKLDEFLADAPGNVRAKLAKALDSKRVLEAGGPDIGMLRVALTNPDLYNTPTGYMGYHIADFDPRVSKAASGHSAYPRAAVGTDVRGLGGSVPPELILPDLFAGLQKMGKIKGRPDLYEQRMDYYGAGRAPQKKAKEMLGYPLPKTQVVTQEMIDKLGAYVEKHGLKSIPPAMLTALAGLGLAGGNEAQAQESSNGQGRD